MITQVTSRFDSWISHTFAEKPQIMRWLLAHERKGSCINRVCEQLKKAEQCNIGRRFDVRRFNMLIDECAKMFSNAAVNYQHQAILSTAERNRRIDEASRFDNLEAMFAEDQKEAMSDKVTSYPGVQRVHDSDAD
jgi:hypothetical protein